MARSYARVLPAIWTDPDFTSLPADAQRLYLLLVSQPEISHCGVLSWNPKRVAHLAPDTPPAKVAKALRTLIDRGYVILDEATDELAIRTFLRHDGVLDSPNSLKGAANAYRTIHSTLIRQRVLDQLPPAVAAVWPDGISHRTPKQIGELLGKSKPDVSPDGKVETKVDGNPLGPVPVPVPFPVSSSSSPNPAPPSAAPAQPANGASSPRGKPARTTRTTTTDDDPPITDITDACWRILAKRHLAIQPAGSVRNRPGWLERAAANALAEHGEHAAKLLDDDPTLTADELADLLEPAPALDDDPTGDKAAAASWAETEAKMAADEALRTLRQSPEYQAWETRQFNVWEAEGRPPVDQFDYPDYPNERDPRPRP